MSTKKMIYALIVPLMAGVLLAGQARGDAWTGSLSYVADVSYGFQADAANANNTWRASSQLTWTVTNEASGGPDGYAWLYTYTMEVADWAPRRMMIETSLAFTLDNIDLATVAFIVDGTPLAYDTAKISVGWHVPTTSPGTDFRDMPDTRYGLFFADSGANGDVSTTISFWSNAAPGWGDLYTNCGGNGNRGWNSGFLLDNPDNPPADGSISNHVLVPVGPITPIPEPGTGLILVSLVVLVLSRRLRPGPAVI